jgi:CO/xanthine dehydrogenase Mo-binding subunit
LIDRLDVAPSGSSEPSIRAVSAAIASAIFDATGQRLQHVPFSPDRVKAAIA